MFKRRNSILLEIRADLLSCLTNIFSRMENKHLFKSKLICCVKSSHHIGCIIGNYETNINLASCYGIVLSLPNCRRCEDGEICSVHSVSNTKPALSHRHRLQHTFFKSPQVINAAQDVPITNKHRGRKCASIRKTFH